MTVPDLKSSNAAFLRYLPFTATAVDVATSCRMTLRRSLQPCDFIDVTLVSIFNN